MTRTHPRFYCPTCGRLTAVTAGDRGWLFTRHQDPSIARRCPTTWAPKTGPGRPDPEGKFDRRDTPVMGDEQPNLPRG